mmetsp:Transcript_68893/g.189140  ORF Transcript_68893/g.189140 Transcript_68893/m.189140 type:complete len:223 (+) Transcript_68893:237-905(+)
MTPGRRRRGGGGVFCIWLVFAFGSFCSGLVPRARVRAPGGARWCQHVAVGRRGAMCVLGAMDLRSSLGGQLEGRLLETVSGPAKGGGPGGLQVSAAGGMLWGGARARQATQGGREGRGRPWVWRREWGPVMGPVALWGCTRLVRVGRGRRTGFRAMATGGVRRRRHAKMRTGRARCGARWWSHVTRLGSVRASVRGIMAHGLAVGTPGTHTHWEWAMSHRAG